MQHEIDGLEQIDRVDGTAQITTERIDLATVPSTQLWQAISRWRTRAPHLWVTDPSAIDLSAFTSSEVAAELSNRAAQGRAARRVLKRCKDCGLPFGSRDMRKHRQVCIRNPRRKKGTDTNGH